LTCNPKTVLYEQWQHALQSKTSIKISHVNGLFPAVMMLELCPRVRRLLPNSNAVTPFFPRIFGKSLKLIGTPSPLEKNRTVKDYFDLLIGDTGLILVGGQAVNLWAEKYQTQDANILAFQPFTSRDADFYRRLPKLHLPGNWESLPNPSKGRMRLVSHVLTGPEGQTAEIIRSVNGLKPKDIENGAISIHYAGKPMWFLCPVALFQAKLANVNSLTQEERQDIRHLKLLVPVTRCFFKEVLESYQKTERPIALLRWLRQHVENLRLAVSQGHIPQLEWSDCLPIEHMATHSNQSVVNFQKRLKVTPPLSDLG